MTKFPTTKKLTQFWPEMIKSLIFFKPWISKDTSKKRNFTSILVSNTTID